MGWHKLCLKCLLVAYDSAQTEDICHYSCVLLLLVYEVDEVADALKDGVDLVAGHLTTTALLENNARDITQGCLLRLHV